VEKLVVTSSFDLNLIWSRGACLGEDVGEVEMQSDGICGARQPVFHLRGRSECPWEQYTDRERGLCCVLVNNN
jgi:hypothetical protein